jgi:hypothetical protein
MAVRYLEMALEMHETRSEISRNEDPLLPDDLAAVKYLV